MPEWVRGVVRRKGKQLISKAARVRQSVASWGPLGDMRLKQADAWDKLGTELAWIGGEGTEAEVEGAYHMIVHGPVGTVFQIC